MRRLLILASTLLITSLSLAADKPAATIQLPPKPLLPMSFAGWTATATPIESTRPGGTSMFDYRRADLAKEVGFKRGSEVQYLKGHSSMIIAALQFEDATGAFAYQSNFPTSEKFRLPSNPGPSPHAKANFRHGDTIVMVDWQGTASEHPNDDDLQVLAKLLPIPFGSKGEIPLLPSYLPKVGLNAWSVEYALGPNGLVETTSPLAGKLDPNTGILTNAGKVDFSTDAEVVVAGYGSGTLTLVEYPTPQMAAAQLKTLSAQLNLQPQKSLPDGLVGGNDEVMWRTGPLVGLTSGMSQAQAIKLAGEVHYESAITWDKPQGYVSDAWRAAHLYLGIFALAGILCAASVILGLFFGGARAITRVMRGKSASAVQDTEFISLSLGHGGDYKPGEKN